MLAKKTTFPSPQKHTAVMSSVLSTEEGEEERRVSEWRGQQAGCCFLENFNPISRSDTAGTQLVFASLKYLFFLLPSYKKDTAISQVFSTKLI